MSRTSNSIKFVIASAACQIIILVCGLILPPMLIAQYGSDVNGLLNLVKQLMSYFSIVCLGLGASAQVALYKPIANSDWKEINAILAAARHLYNLSGLFFSLLIILSSLIVPLLIKTDIPTMDVISVILITGIGSICEYVIISKYKVFLCANQQQYINSRITAEGIILNTLVTVALIKLKCNIVIIQVGASVVYVLRLLYTIRYVKKHFPQISFHNQKAAFDKLKNRWSAFSYQLSRMIITLSPMIIVSIVGSLSDASVFSIYFMVYSSLAMIAGIFSSGMQAPFGDIIAQNENHTLKNAFASYEFLYTFILSVCFICSTLLMTSFVGSYIENTDGVNYIRPNFSLAMCLSFFISNLRIPFTTLIEAKGLFKINNRYNLVEALSFIVLSIILMHYQGLLGIGIAGILTGAPRTLHYILYCKAHFGEAINVMKTIIKFFLTLALTMLLYHFIRPAQANNVFSWILQSIPVVILLTAAILVLDIIIDRKSFSLVWDRMKSILRKQTLI